MAERPLEICCECDCETGRAGRADDSLYTENDWGPYCPDCWQDADYWRTLTDEKVTELTRLTAQRDELREALQKAAESIDAIEQTIPSMKRAMSLSRAIACTAIKNMEAS